MKLRIPSLFTSFSVRLTCFILLVATLCFVTAFMSSYHFAHDYVRREAMEHAQTSLDNTILQIDNVLGMVETAVHNLAWLVEDNLEDPEYMYTLTRRLLEENPYVCGSAIAFEPFYYADKGIYYSPYSYREEDELKDKQLGTEDYDYPHMDWYQIPKLLHTPYWSEPYYDEGGSDLIMTTYSLPLYDATGRMFAIFTADLSLEWFAEKVNAVRPYPGAYTMMLGRGGTYLVHKRKEAILNETIFASAIAAGDVAMKETGHRMVNGERGMAVFPGADDTYYLFYAPIKATGWSVAVACPYTDIFAVVDDMRNTMLLIALLGLSVMALLCHYTIRRLTAPLARFARSAREIAQGHFDAVLPVVRSRDEMKTLHDSFGYMQQSLVGYMDELQKQTAHKERIESELRIARSIQMGMVPKIFPPFPERSDVDLYAALQPAKEVGGDLYDFFIEDNKCYFIIGDVSGKGVPASLVMAVTCRLFRTVAAHFARPAEIVSALNNTLTSGNDSNMFCTCFLGILDLTSGHLQYCNAGHNAPVRMSPGETPAFMEVCPNLPLGLFEDFAYEGQECRLKPGTSLFLYTDGVTEAENNQKELYSEERLLQQLARLQDETPHRQVEAMQQDILHHADGAGQSDDITMMCIHYKP